MKIFRTLLTTLVITGCLTLSVLSQELTGGIEGTVTDSTGAVVPNMTLTISTAKSAASGTTTTGTGAGFRRTVTTSDEGFFRAVQIHPGTYDVVTTPSRGFGEARYENVTVSIGNNTQLSIAVIPGDSVATVDVNVEAGQRCCICERLHIRIIAYTVNGDATNLDRKDARYGQPSTFQSPRSVRFGFRLLF